MTPFHEELAMAAETTHPLVRIESFILIAIGGFAESNLRYAAEFIFQGMVATLVVNSLGSFVLGADRRLPRSLDDA